MIRMVWWRWDVYIWKTWKKRRLHLLSMLINVNCELPLGSWRLYRLYTSSLSSGNPPIPSFLIGPIHHVHKPWRPAVSSRATKFACVHINGRCLSWRWSQRIILHAFLLYFLQPLSRLVHPATPYHLSSMIFVASIGANITQFPWPSICSQSHLQWSLLQLSLFLVDLFAAILYFWQMAFSSLHFCS